jgi:hypothetical protein
VGLGEGGRGENSLITPLVRGVFGYVNWYTGWVFWGLGEVGAGGGGGVGGRQDCGRMASKTILCHFFLLYFLFNILAFLLHASFSATCALFFFVENM